MSEVIVEVEEISKRFKIGSNRLHLDLRAALTGLFTRPFRRLLGDEKGGVSSSDNHIWALQNISFTDGEGGLQLGAKTMFEVFVERQAGLSDVALKGTMVEFAIYNSMQNLVALLQSDFVFEELVLKEGPNHLICTLDKLRLSPGHYTINSTVRADSHVMDYVEQALSFTVDYGRF